MTKVKDNHRLPEPYIFTHSIIPADSSKIVPDCSVKSVKGHNAQHFYQSVFIRMNSRSINQPPPVVLLAQSHGTENQRVWIVDKITQHAVQGSRHIYIYFKVFPSRKVSGIKISFCFPCTVLVVCGTICYSKGT